MYMIAFLSLSVFIYGADIYSHHMTLEPAAAATMYIFIALAALLSPLLAYRRTSRWFAYIEVVLLVLGALLAAYIGASATFEHTVDWMKWVPFYG
jgi:putative membrane protein